MSGLSERAQGQIDHILERPGWGRQEFGVWCVNPVWTHQHSTHREREQAEAAIPEKCHYGSPAEFVILERTATYSFWWQP